MTACSGNGKLAMLEQKHTEGTPHESCESDSEALWLSDSRATKRCVRQAQRSVDHLSNVRG